MIIIIVWTINSHIRIGESSYSEIVRDKCCEVASASRESSIHGCEKELVAFWKCSLARLRVKHAMEHAPGCGSFHEKIKYSQDSSSFFNDCRLRSNEFSLGKLNRDDVCRLPEKALGNLPWCLCSMLGKTDLLLSVGCNEPQSHILHYFLVGNSRIMVALLCLLKSFIDECMHACIQLRLFLMH